MGNIEERIRRLKPFLKQYCDETLQPSRKAGKNFYICPICHSGTGEHQTSAFSLYDDVTGLPLSLWKCHKCGNHGDIIDLAQAITGDTDKNKLLERLESIFKTYPTSPPARTDYSSFFVEANKHLLETNYHRGISIDTLNRFKVGFVKDWKHPKSPNAKPSPRLIVPTSINSYLARDTREDLTDEQKEHSKQKVNGSNLLNKEALENTEPVFIVEGEFDALSIIDAGFIALGLGGVGNTRKLINALEHVNTPPALLLALDNDQAGREAQKKLSAQLKDKGVFFTEPDILGDAKDANEALNADREQFINKLTEAVAEAEKAQEEQAQQEKKELISSIEAHRGDFLCTSFYKDIENGKNNKCYSTGLKAVDAVLDGGLYTGLYIIGAISSLGKTTFCLQVADNIARAGDDVLFFSLEMSANELIAKSLSRITFLTSGKWEKGKTARYIMNGEKGKPLSLEDMKVLSDAAATYKSTIGQHLYIYEGVGDIGVIQIRQKVEEHIRATGKKPVVFIDYLQILAPYDVHSTDKQNTDRAVTALKRLSRDYNIPVIGISSFNRENYSEPVSMASFKESGAIEYSSDVLIGLQYEGMGYQQGEKEQDRRKRIKDLLRYVSTCYKDKQRVKINTKILKNRYGAKGEAIIEYATLFNTYTS